ncbi:hypothetical protein RSAG8_12421, partial [Rhizoctonia solani AG-8 WAC10335]
MSRGFMVWQVVPNVAASSIAMPQQCVFDRRITRHKLRMHYVCPDWRRDRQIASAGSIRISVSSCSSCARCWISDVGGLFLPSKVCMQLDAQGELPRPYAWQCLNIRPAFLQTRPQILLIPAKQLSCG